jgi:hypothetical protein
MMISGDERQQGLQGLKVGRLPCHHVFHPPGQVALLDRCIRVKLHDKGAVDRQVGWLVSGWRHGILRW